MCCTLKATIEVTLSKTKTVLSKVGGMGGSTLALTSCNFPCFIIAKNNHPVTSCDNMHHFGLGAETCAPSKSHSLMLEE